MKPRQALAAAMVILLAAVCAPAKASPFLIRYAGSNTALAVDQGTIVVNGHFRSAWTYVFYRRGSIFVRERMQIFARRQVFDCRHSAEKDLATISYVDTGKEVGRTGPDAHWTVDLSGSNTAIVVNAVCGGPDEAWTRLKAAGVFAAFHQTWK